MAFWGVHLKFPTVLFKHVHINKQMHIMKRNGPRQQLKYSLVAVLQQI